ncbi:FAD/NAD-binding domain-containing protein [Phellopilus nigrolimitatus]|nr:FAD/NAD-binding domain-containing protein [Phellopilus nigrolimitatus]
MVCSLRKFVEAEDASAITDLLLEDAFWRDMLALTWDFRTFEGSRSVKQFLQDLLPTAGLSKLQLNEGSVMLQQPYPDIAWIQGMFTFETKVGLGSGIFRIVPTSSGDWKGHVVYTNLEELKGFPERSGAHRNPFTDHGMWAEKRRRETSFEDREPAVILIGGGQSGLDVAARLKVLDVPTLVIEKNARVGDQWRGRYEALCLHDPVWYDHMPYISFPATWPIWTPAAKLADWLESYAKSMEIDIWLSSTVTKLEQHSSANGWKVTVERSDGSTRTFKPRHVVFATGLGGGAAKFPTYSGMDKFKGEIIHSTKHKSARNHVGKKVVIIGAATSAHDIAHDYYNHGVDVTIYQRSSTYIMSNKYGMPKLMQGSRAPPTDIADRIFASYPSNLILLVHQRVVKDVAEDDKELLDGLKKRGFKLNFGIEGSGLITLARTRGGGYYLDVGASQLIVDGKIKLKSDSAISHFSKDAIIFEDGAEIPADVVIFATGYGDVKGILAQLAGEDVAGRVKQIWGLDEEGENYATWRWSGLPGIYFMMGNLAMSRFHSKHVALQIKAQEEHVHGERYTK